MAGKKNVHVHVSPQSVRCHRGAMQCAQKPAPKSSQTTAQSLKLSLTPRKQVIINSAKEEERSISMTDSQLQQRLVEVAGLGACLLLKNLAWYYASRRQSKCQVGQVQQIVIYPVKSCRGIQLPQAEVFDGGVFWDGVRDRSYLVMSATDNKFVSLKVFAPLHQVQPLLDPDRPGHILLSAEGHPTLPVPDAAVLNVPVTFGFKTDTLTGLDCGDDVAAWLNAVCERQDLRLVFCPSNARNAADKMRALDKLGGLLPVYNSGLHEAPGNRVAFADKTPILLVSDKSLETLNGRLAGKHPGVDWRNFRPNLVISGVGRDREEDGWGFVFAGSCVLAAAFPCERCVMVNLDYSAGDRAVQPPGSPVLAALAPYRSAAPFKNPLFGVNCTVEAPGRVAVRDPVFASV